MTSVFLATVRRDLRILSRKKSDWLIPIALFAVITAIFPLSMDTDRQLLAHITPAIIWVSVLLVSTLTLDKIFKYDYSNGSLEQFLIAQCGLYPIVLAKIASHWLAMGLPLLVSAPVYAYMLGLPAHAMPALILVLLMSTPVLSAFGALGAALTMSIRQGGVLLALLMLPLYVPLLIFSANAVDMAASGFAIDGVLAILGAMLIVSLLLVPWLICAALRVVAD